jgi:hypothetical protein
MLDGVNPISSSNPLGREAKANNQSSAQRRSPGPDELLDVQRLRRAAVFALDERGTQSLDLDLTLARTTSLAEPYRPRATWASTKSAKWSPSVIEESRRASTGLRGKRLKHGSASFFSERF